MKCGGFLFFAGQLSPVVLEENCEAVQIDMTPINQADTAWMLIATAMVLVMTPALGFFYGGLVRAKNTLNTMMMSYVALGFVGIAWAIIGYSFAFSTGSNWLGGLDNALFKSVGLDAKGTIPHILFAGYQATFCIITAALISGAIVERMRFGPYVAFITLWSVLVYAPIAHWVWGGGWLGKLGALDFAGGTVVHINAAAAALVVAVVLGARKDYARQAIIPQNVPFTLLGAGLLWFGWFGFNGGSALAANASAALAFANTMFAPMGTLVVWSILDITRTKKTTAVGAATAIVVGLVAITPAAGFVSPVSGIAIGAIAAIPSYFTILWRAGTRLDDSLDVIAAHGVGGTVGALLTGVLAQKIWNGTADGALFGNPKQLGIQVVAIVATILYSVVGTFVILKAIALVAPLRASQKEEGVGMDVTQHGEEAYSRGEGAILVHPDRG
jgi:ammonium transporter, Amt family